ncbi:MAG: hypothetical protein ABJG88_03320 [Litorimonas sp.]
MFDFMKKTLERTYKARKIRLENHWFNGFKVFVDEVLIHHDHRMVWTDKDRAFFEFELKTQDGLEPVALFVDTGVVNIEILLQISGETIARTDVPPQRVIA